VPKGGLGLKKHLVVLGGGIKGAAIAALSSILGDYDVSLVEKDCIGSGTTSTNHGRLHLGTAGWRKDSAELIQRRRTASEVVRRLPNTIVTKRDAIYCFEDDADADRFQDIIANNEIPFRVSNDIELSHNWIEPGAYKSIIQVPEHSFNPARLAGRLAQTCTNAGGRILVGRHATELMRRGEKLIVTLNDGSELVADAVINTMSRWCLDLIVPPVAPRPEINWVRWKLLCLKSATLPTFDRLDQVVVIIDRLKRMPSAIPHEHWITLDYNTTPIEEVPSPDGNDMQDWRPFDEEDSVDRDIYAAVSAVFYPLLTLSPTERNGRLFSLAGIQGRLVSAAPGSRNSIHATRQFPDYYVAFGGQASTGILDAIDIINHLRYRNSMQSLKRGELVDRLVELIAVEPISGALPMRWEQHPTF